MAVEQREVYDLFLQLSDSKCDVGYVTAAPVSHYVTGHLGSVRVHPHCLSSYGTKRAFVSVMEIWANQHHPKD
eukprot:g7298.t1